MQTSRESRAQTALCIALCTAFIAVLLFPYAKNGLWFDDALNSQMWGMLNRFDVGIWDFSVRVSKVWFYEAGRILLCWPVLYGFFYVTREPEIVRLAAVLLVLVHVGLVVRLLREVRIPWPTIGVFVLFLVALFQIRANDDPVAAYASFCQLLGIALSVALLLLVRWWNTGATWYLFASIGLVMVSLLGYELNVVFVPVCMVTILVSRHPHRLRNLAMLLVPFLLFIAVNLYAKHGASQPYQGSTFGALSAVPISYMKQLSAAFPGSFYLFRARSEFPLASLVATTVTNPMAWLTAALALVSFSLVARRHSVVSKKMPSGALATAAAFLLMPPVLISISARYQSFIGWGDAHLPVYYQYFGLAFLGASAFSWVCRKYRAPTIWIVAPLFAAYAALNWMMNLRQVDYLDAIFAEPRSSLVAALRSGLMEPVRDGDLVEIVNAPIFINGNLIYQTIQKRVATPNEAASIKYFQSLPGASAKSFRLERDPVAPHSWRLTATAG